MTIGILLTVFLESLSAGILYYGLNNNHSKLILGLRLIGWISIYLVIGGFLLIALSVWTIYLIINDWSKADEKK